MLTDSKCFRFKASFSPCISFELLHYDLEKIAAGLDSMVKPAQNFFSGSPVIIDIEKIKSTEKIDFNGIKKILSSHQIIAIGIRGGSTEQQMDAAALGLPMIKAQKSTAPIQEAAEPEKSASITKIITQPIRSGMQIFAKDSDLIITGQVSPGAELMADGHIHVYGTLRGRILAGANGNHDARIFCQAFEADLIAIAGYYLTRDEIKLPKNNHKPIQVYLAEKKLKIEVC